MRDLDRFRKNIAGSKDELVDFVHVIGPDGDFKKISGIDTILSSWSNILLTPRGSYVFDPQFGSELYKYLYEPADDITQEAIKNEVKDVLIRYDDRAFPEDVIVDFLPNMKGFMINVIVNYRGKREQLKVVITEESYFNFIRQGV